MMDRDFRRRAEERLKKRQAADAPPTAADEQRLLHELQVQQIELELINEELAATEERMRQALEATDQVIWDYDLETDEVHLSAAWPRFLRTERAPTNLTIRQLADMVPEADRGMVRDAMIQAVKGPGASGYKVTHRIRKPDGGLIWVRSEGRVVQRAADGRALRMAGVKRDITERKRLEDELRRREARYRAVIETSKEGFLAVARSGQLLEVNDAYVRHSGYGREELLTMQVADLDATETATEIAVRIEQIRAAGNDRFETSHRCADGALWPVEILVNYWPALDCMFMFVVDCTERKRAEKQIRVQRQELEMLQRSQIAAHTAAVFAHELNQPLGAISSYSDAALMMLSSDNPDLDRLRETIEKSREQALRAGGAIRELLALQGTGLGTTEALDLNAEIHDALALARADSELQFRSVLGLPENLPAVRANRVHLKKVLLNLLRNAIEAMREANTVQPTLIVRVQALAEEGLAQVTVQDNGPGIGSAEAAVLFESFFTTKEGGTGMGLAVSRSLMEANGGQLWCDPAPGPGAIFHLTLPFADEGAGPERSA